MKQTKFILFLPLLLGLNIFQSCRKDSSQIVIVQPGNDMTFNVGSTITFTAEAENGIANYSRVCFYLDDSLVSTIVDLPYNFSIKVNRADIGQHEIKVVGYSNDMNSSYTTCIFGVTDYRDPYLGDYNFTLYTHSWEMDQPDTYDTLFWPGVIRIFETTDSYEDQYFGSGDQSEDPDQKITVCIGGYVFICSLLEQDGKLVEKYGYHYHHEGEFVTQDSISFVLGGLGGLGGGSDYQIMGKKN